MVLVASGTRADMDSVVHRWWIHPGEKTSKRAK
jgi:hypothetical protein